MLGNYPFRWGQLGAVLELHLKKLVLALRFRAILRLTGDDVTKRKPQKRPTPKTRTQETRSLCLEINKNPTEQSFHLGWFFAFFFNTGGLTMASFMHEGRFTITTSNNPLSPFRPRFNSACSSVRAPSSQIAAMTAR